MKAPLALIAMLAAVPALAQDAPDPARRALLVSLIEANGCRMSDTEAGQILPQHGFTQDETRAISMAMMDEGAAELDGADLVLHKTDKCP